MVSMNKTDRGQNATWTKTYISDVDYRDIMWEDLLEIAKDHWDWLMHDRDGGNAAYTGQGSCIVSALFLPKTSGGVVFLSTIPRGEMHTRMSTSGANAWRAAQNASGSRRLDAEDGSEYLFETSGYARGIVNQRGEYITPDRDNPHGPMKIAVWGRHADSPRGGEQIECCSKCRRVADTLRVKYCDRIKLRQERSYAQPPTSSGHHGTSSSRPSGSSSSRPSASGSGSRPSGQSSSRTTGGSSSTQSMTGMMSSLKVSPSKTSSSAPAKKRPSVR